MEEADQELTGEGRTNYFRESLVAELRTLKDRSDALALLAHGGTAGTAREGIVHGLLKRLLPERYGLVTGVLIDVLGNQSPQLDAVVIDRSVIPPVMLSGNEATIPVEAGVMAIEVKTTVDRACLDQLRRQAEAMDGMYTQLEGSQSLPLSLFGLDSRLKKEEVKCFMMQCRRLVSACVLSRWTLLSKEGGIECITPNDDSEYLPEIAYLGMTVAALDQVCITRRISTSSELWKTYLIGPDKWNGRL